MRNAYGLDMYKDAHLSEDERMSGNIFLLLLSRTYFLFNFLAHRVLNKLLQKNNCGFIRISNGEESKKPSKGKLHRWNPFR